MYNVQVEPDKEAVLDNGSKIEPIITLKDEHGGISHIFHDDHCFVLCNGSVDRPFKMTHHWFREAVDALRNYHFNQEAKKVLKDIPLKGLVILTIPVGNIPPKEIPNYIGLMSKQLLNKDNLRIRVEAAGYTFFFLPSRPDKDGHHVGPRVELARFDGDDDATTTVAKILQDLPEGLKAKIG